MSENNLALSHNVGLDLVEEEKAWLLYEKLGSIDAVAKVLNIRPHMVKACLCRDQIRLIDVQTTRMEEVARRWEDNDKKAADLTSKSMDVLEAILKHIAACVKSGEPTDLVGLDGEKRMSPTQAYQWLIEKKVIADLSKVGINAAKISEGMRLMAFDKEHAKGSNHKLDPSRMTDEELWTMVADMEATGQQLPWGVQQWKDAQAAKRLARVAGTGS